MVRVYIDDQPAPYVYESAIGWKAEQDGHLTVHTAQRIIARFAVGWTHVELMEDK